MGAIISRVDPGGMGQKFGFRAGDEIITINGQLLRDILDYYFQIVEFKLEINYIREGMPHSTVIHKNESESLGLDFENEIFDGIRTCNNKCMFCFVDQMPRKMRKTLYLKDDDYRLSFLHGNYITLTNISEKDLRRITEQRLSPLYVSIHATDPSVRVGMLGSQSAGNILKPLNKLKLHGIQCHTQIVIIPNVNDGKVLKKTLQDLFSLHPTIKTVSIVPVGLTKFKNKDKNLRSIRPAEARQIYVMVKKFQERARNKFGFPIFYMSDEFYLMMEKDFPKHSHYGYFDQIGNGVGLCRKLITDFNRRRRYLTQSLEEKRNVWVITGILGEKILKPLIKEFRTVKKLTVSLIPVRNSFFGKTTTVTGLLTGQDILRTLQKELKNKKKPDLIIYPDVLLNKGLFLDDYKPDDIQKRIGVPFKSVATNAGGLIGGITGQQIKHDRKYYGKKGK
ncbi:MAG: DUF512 domain-containing protein [Candidatus Eremiobacteraeota bacterium]|nr:DUF512 domain-containing protein [Candidatus Eremiobacteraeota bacterium]